MSNDLDQKFQELNQKLKDNPPPPPEKRRLGKFRISFDWLDQDWHKALPLFSGLVVIRAEARYDFDGVEYIAFCDQFEEVPEYQEAPEYAAIMHREEDGTVTLKGWQRQ